VAAVRAEANLLQGGRAQGVCCSDERFLGYSIDVNTRLINVEYCSQGILKQEL
jgi:hypothetical protein